MRRLGLGLLIAAAGMLAGCNFVRGVGLWLAPRQIQKAEFHLTKQRLCILIESAQPGQDDPVFVAALHDALVQVFREKDINDQVVPRDELLRVQRDNADFSRWSLQRIGRAVDAKQVLYLRLDDLRIKVDPATPVVEPSVALHMKVVGTEAKTGGSKDAEDTVRLWPVREERDGRGVRWSRPPREAGAIEEVDAEAVKLAREAAWQIAAPFYDVDLETKPPREP